MPVHKIDDLSSESVRDRTPAQSRQPAKLSPREVFILKKCERIVSLGLKTFADVGDALGTIRNQRLYREKYPDFQTYCREQWGFDASRARQLISASEVFKDVADCAVAKPVNEVQMRPLASLDTETRKQVWTEATARAGSASPTERSIKAVIQDIVPADPETQQIAVKDMASLIGQMVHRMKRTLHAIESWDGEETGLTPTEQAELCLLLQGVRSAMNDVLSQLN